MEDWSSIVQLADSLSLITGLVLLIFVLIRGLLITRQSHLDILAAQKQYADRGWQEAEKARAELERNTDALNAVADSITPLRIAIEAVSRQQERRG